jgi:GNAT superfamily N-acetyltransferase
MQSLRVAPGCKVKPESLIWGSRRVVARPAAQPRQSIVTVHEPPDRGEAAGPTPARPAFARPATPADRETLRVLRAQAFADLGPARGGAMYLERHAAELPELHADWTSSTRRVWLGGLHDVELGYLIGTVASVASGGNVGVIEGIYVDREARACGIGERMLALAIDWFRSQGCVGVEATALPGERATKNFFEEHGLKARLLVVYRSLTDEELVDDEPNGD